MGESLPNFKVRKTSPMQKNPLRKILESQIEVDYNPCTVNQTITQKK